MCQRQLAVVAGAGRSGSVARRLGLFTRNDADDSFTWFVLTWSWTFLACESFAPGWGSWSLPIPVHPARSVSLLLEVWRAPFGMLSICCLQCIASKLATKPAEGAHMIEAFGFNISLAQ